MEQPLRHPVSSEVIIQSESTEPLWTVEDVAIYLRLNPETVRMMARSSRIPSLKVGKAWRFRSGQIKAWLAASGIDLSANHQKEIEEQTNAE